MEHINGYFRVLIAFLIVVLTVLLTSLINSVVDIGGYAFWIALAIVLGAVGGAFKRETNDTPPDEGGHGSPNHIESDPADFTSHDHNHHSHH